MKAADDTFMDDSQDSTLMDTMDENTNMSFDMEGSHQGFPEIPTPKPTKKVTLKYKGSRKSPSQNPPKR